MITGNVIGGTLRNPETLILYDESTGIEYTASMVDSEDVELTATVNDVREGKTVALESGVETGEKFIPAYHTMEGVRVITNGSQYKLTNLSDHNTYDFTKLQTLFCEFNTSLLDSVLTHKVSINMDVYEVGSTVSIATIVKNPTDKTIDTGLINNTGKIQIIRFFTYKEI